jgi:phosphatidylglycerol:prolipoprotein diacylglycerol transferase
MHPYLFDVPLPGGREFHVPSYGACILVGFLFCVFLARRRARRMGINPVDIFDMAVAVLMGGIVGGRAFYVIHHWAAFREAPWQAFNLTTGGLAFFGGFFGGAAAALITIGWKGMPLRPTLDVSLSLVPLGHAFGRLGCFLQGCCYGRVTDLPLGVEFPRVLSKEGFLVGSPAYVHQRTIGWAVETVQWFGDRFSPSFMAEFHDRTVMAATAGGPARYFLLASQTSSLPVHPTQLYEIGYNLLFFALLSWLLWRRRRAGNVACLYAVCYGTARFVNEFLRVDTEPLVGPLTVFHLIAAAVAVTGAVLLARNMRAAPEPLPEPWNAAGGESDQGP